MSDNTLSASGRFYLPPIGSLSVDQPSVQPSSSPASTRPRALDYFVDKRRALRASGKPEVRKFARLLQKAHDQFMNGRLSVAQHKATCRAIQKAAAMLCGSAEYDSELLHKLGLPGTKQDDPPLDNSDYTAIAEDASVQMDRQRGANARLEDRCRNPNVNRDLLLRPDKLVANTFGGLLQEMHDQLLEERITPEAHSACAQKILKAAEALNGNPDEFSEEALRSVGLGGRTQEHRLTNEEYLALRDEINVQRHPDHGVVAERTRMRQARAAAQRQLHQSTLDLNDAQRRIASRRDAHGAPNRPSHQPQPTQPQTSAKIARQERREALRKALDAENLKAIVAVKAHVAGMQKGAPEAALNLGRRVAGDMLMYAKKAVESGTMGPLDAIAVYGLTHIQHILEVLEFAANIVPAHKQSSQEAELFDLLNMVNQPGGKE